MIKVTRKPEKSNINLISEFTRRTGKTKANIARRKKAMQFRKKVSELEQKKKALRIAKWKKELTVRKRLAKF